MLKLPTIITALANHRPDILTADRHHAAVAMVLRENAKEPEVLFIVRAPHDTDPWSGDIGFPGGRLDPGDVGPRAAAERETFEELALDLGDACYLGRLDDLYGATLPILVSCFVYQLTDDPPLVPNHEVAEAFWFPLGGLLDRSRHHQAELAYRGRSITHPAVDLLGPGRTVLWGITYRLLQSFFALHGLAFGAEAVIRKLPE